MVVGKDELQVALAGHALCQRNEAVVQRGDVENLLNVSGRWEPRDQEQLAFQVGGAVRRVNVRRGDSVTAGADVISKL